MVPVVQRVWMKTIEYIMKRSYKSMALLLFLGVGLLHVGQAAEMFAPEFSGSVPASVPRHGNNFLDFRVEDAGKLNFSSRIDNLGRLDVVAPSMLPGIVLDKGGATPSEFSKLYLEGYVLTTEIGKPSLPIRMEIIEIPFGAVPKVVYNKVEYVDVPLSSLGSSSPLIPSQVLQSKGFKGKVPFSFDAEAYNRDYFVIDINGQELKGDEQLVSVLDDGVMRDSRLGRVLISPVRYNAVTSTLRIYTVLDFDVVFEGADFQTTVAMKQRYSSQALPTAKQVINPFSLPQAKARSYQSPIPYVIVADPMFKDALQDFIKWKTRLGFRVTEAYVGEGGLEKSDVAIRDYLKGLYDNATEENPAPVFVLLVGDVDQVPAHRYENPLSSSFNGHVSDLYYAEYTGDKMPEVAYGRMSATSEEELLPQLEKTMYMEGLRLEDASFLGNAVAIAGFDLDHGDTHLNPTINYMDNVYLSQYHKNTYKYLYPESQNREKDIIANINSGVGAVFYTAHGLSDGWVNPDINIEQVPNMENKGMYPLMVGNCCLSAKFDSKVCFGESLLRAKDAGAVTYIGATNNTYFPQDVAWAIGYPKQGFLPDAEHTYETTGMGMIDAWYHTHGEDFSLWVTTAYALVQAGNMEVQRSNTNAYVDYYWQVYHVLGDPSYMPYTRMISAMDVSYREVLPEGSTSYKVTAVPYARVVLSHDKEVIGVATANAQGDAEVNLEGIDFSGTLDLTVVAQDYATFMASVKVISADANYAGAVDVSYRLGESNLTGSDEFAYGNTYEAIFKVANMGKEKVQKLDVKLIPLVSWLEVEDASYTLDQAIEPGAEVLLDHAFRIRVSPDVPDMALARYKVVCVPDGNEADSAVHVFEMRLRSTEMEFYDMLLFNEAGDRCYVLGTNQTLKARLLVKNKGDFEAGDVKMKLSTQSPYIGFSTSEFSLGNMAAGEIDTLEFDLTSKTVPQYYETYTLSFDFTSRGREKHDSIHSYIEPYTEDFETGGFLSVNWDETSDWEIDSTYVYEGKYSAASHSSVSDNGSSVLWMMFQCPAPDRVSFRYAVSSETTATGAGDYLIFSVNGEQKGRWGGIDSTWKYASFDVPAGEVILEWKYLKDSDTKAGKDKVWIDNVLLPMGVTLNPDMDLKPEGVANELFPAVDAKMNVISSGNRFIVNIDADHELSGNLFLVNVMGHEVRMLERGLRIPTGNYRQEYDLNGLSQGFYICVFQTAQGRLAVKFVKM